MKKGRKALVTGGTRGIERPYRMILKYHEVFGQWHVPNIRAYVPHERGFFIVKTNQDGMRSSNNYERQKSSHHLRILVFGDSYTAGEGVNNEERFTDLLEQQLKHVEVLNFGLNGSGLDQQLLIFEHLGDQFGGDIILICPFVENIRRVVLKYWPVIDGNGRQIFIPKPYFRFHEGALDLQHSPVPKERLSFTDAPIDHRSQFDGQRIPLSSSRQFFSRHLFPILAPIAKPFYQPFPQYNLSSSPEWQLTQALLERFLKKTSPRKVVLAPLPLYSYIESFSRPTYLKRYREFARRHPELLLIDLLPYFKKLSPLGRRQCRYSQDSHYTPLAHTIVAEALSKEMTKLFHAN